VIGLLVACRHHVDPDAAMVTRPGPLPAIVLGPPDPAGLLVGDTWRDVDHPFALRPGPSWRIRAGDRTERLRVTFENEALGVRLNAYAISGGDTTPRPRDGCTWTFDDTSRYRALRVTDPVRVATCTPDDPLAARVLGTFVVRDGVAWHFEAVIPAGRLVVGKQASDDLLASVRFVASE
jgi:hypothetical protein